MSNNLINKDFLLWEEIDSSEQAETLEENLSVEDLNLENPSLIRMDMNIIEYPLFSKNNHRKVNQSIKYFFNNDKDVFIMVKPISGDYIPGDFEERVFIALLKIMKKRGFQQTFYVSATELLDEFGLTNKAYYKRIKQSITRLAETSYVFKNTLYLSKIKRNIEDTVNTNIMTIRTISLVNDKKLREELYNDNRIKEIYEITISKYFYDNIIRKGYLVYDSNTLLGIENSTTRTVYMLISKLRFQNLYLKVPSLYLIKRIPLKFNKVTISRTVKSLERCCKELLEKKLITRYNIIKNKKWEESEIEFFFEDVHNNIKQKHFYADKKDFGEVLNNYDASLLISHTEEQSLSPLQEIKKELEENTPTPEMIETVLNSMPIKARDLKTIPNLIRDAIKTHGFQHVKFVAEYMKIHKVGNIRSYFTQALENGWADEYIAKRKNEERKKVVQVPLFIESESDLIHTQLKNETKEKYIVLSEKEKEDIEKIAYIEYIKKCGAETSAQKRAFKLGKESIIIDYLITSKYFEMNPKIIETIIEEIEPEIEEIESEEIIADIFAKFETFSSYKFKIFQILQEKIEMEKLKMILDFLNFEKEFNSTMDEYTIFLMFNEGQKSRILIKKK
ncbi:replication initiator protein A [Cetobacterium sp. 2A]|uniref:replication initiator protein A n=1 Tax=Cetobacterium sp. 2A TaxID=2754723 RepID=UPI00163C184E|nr:replication initiator protein A [Cetobacterium sp. 2A]MBC2855529.1 replication initiator protein A [Cetobacterium sp. 2A]